MSLSLVPAAHQHTYERMLKSNLQPEEKGVIQQWARDVLGIATEVRVQDAPGGLLSAARQGSEGLMLAVVAAYLQVNVPGGLDVKGYAVDGIGGAGLLIASAFMGHSELGTEARNFGQDATVICAYRKMVDFFARARLASGRELYPHLQPGGPSVSHPASDPYTEAAADL